MSYRQRIRCSARRTDGLPCNCWAIHGGTVCRMHGGAAPQVKAAAAKRLTEHKLDVLATKATAQPITNVLDELGRVAAEIVARKDSLLEISERTDGENPFVEDRLDQALESSARLLLGMARADFDDARAHFNEETAQIVYEIVAGSCARLGVNFTDEQIRRIVVEETCRVCHLELPAELAQPALQA